MCIYIHIYIYIYILDARWGAKAPQLARIFALRPAVCGPRPSLRPQASGAKASDPGLRPQVPDPGRRPETSGAEASDPRPQTPSSRSQTSDLRPQRLNPKTPGLSLRPQVPGLRSAKTPRQATTSTISGLRSAKTPRLATNFDDLRPQTCENAAPGDEFRRSQASDLRKCHARRQKSTISGLRSSKMPCLATNIDDLRPRTCENAAPGDKNRRSEATGLEKIVRDFFFGIPY